MNAKTILVSDVHLGTPPCRVGPLLNCLQRLKMDQLILVGDILNDLKFNRFNETEWKFLSWLRTLTEPNSPIKLIWVQGNHDYLALSTIARVLGIGIYEEYVWTDQGKRYIALHGDQFDDFLIRYIRVSKVAGFAFSIIQRFTSGRLLDRITTQWINAAYRVREGAISYASERKFDGVFCGHTHQAEIVKSNNIIYANTGSWTHIPSSYVVVDGSNINLEFVW